MGRLRRHAGPRAGVKTAVCRAVTRLRPRVTSLKFTLFLLVILCWVTPMVVVGGYSLVTLFGSINSRIRETVRYTADYAGEIGMRELQETFARSRDASYELNIWKSYQTYRSDGDGVELNRGVTAYLSDKYYFDQDFSYACLFLWSQTDDVYYVSRDGPANYSYYREHAREAVQTLARDLGNRTDFVVQGSRIFVVRNLLDKDTFKPYAVLVLQLDPSAVFRDFTTNSLWNGQAMLSLSGKAGWVGKVQPDDRRLNKLTPGTTVIVENGRSIDFYGKLEPDTGDFTLGYKVAVDKSRIFKSYRSLPLILILLMLALLPLLALVLLFFDRRVTRPVAELVHATQAVEAGRLGTQVQPVRGDEIGHIASAFNAMSAQIQSLIDRIVAEQTASRNSRIMALESQINPHFLNNTLEMMNWRSRLRGDEELSRMIESLSTILEAGMNRSREMLIPLRAELAHADAYLYIMSMRFGSRLEIHKHIDEATLDWMVPRLILQPLLENAVVHGLEPVERASLWFTVSRQGECGLRIAVRNNGKQVTDDDMARVERLLREGSAPGGRLGLSNIHERLHLIYGDGAALRFTRESDGGARTEIEIRDVTIHLSLS